MIETKYTEYKRAAVRTEQQRAQVARDIQEMRGKLKLGPTQMAKLLGVAVGTYRKWESGETLPSDAVYRAMDTIIFLWQNHYRIYNQLRHRAGLLKPKTVHYS